MAALESPTTSGLTVANGTYAGQASFAYATDYLQRFQIGLASTAEYILNQESSSDANYADRAIFARMVIANPIYWANSLASSIAADASTITTTCTDQDITNRIWTLWPAWCYKVATISYASTGI